MGEITDNEFKECWFVFTPQAGLTQFHIDWAEGAFDEMRKEKHRKRANLKLVVNR